MGHLIVAEHVQSMLSLDMIYFVPSFISPHKRRGEETLSAHRLKMVRLAVGNRKEFKASDIEILAEGTSFTYTTVEAFRRRFKGAKLFLLIGADNFAEFQEWKFPERIVRQATLVVMTRPNYDPGASKPVFSSSAKFLRVPYIEISSTDIRRRIKLGRTIDHLVPENVRKYIDQHRLYQ
jgi:nicotinate-nucleotide adenylyltransferase